MNQLSTPQTRPEPIRLSEEPDFSIGNFDVQASPREVRWDDRKEQLEATRMQVPVALAHVGGAVVPRDEIIERCWEAGRRSPNLEVF